MPFEFVSGDGEVIQLLQLPTDWCMYRETSFALYNKTLKKWFIPSRRKEGIAKRWRPYWKDLPGRLCRRTTNAEREAAMNVEDDDEDDDDCWFHVDDATTFSYWYYQIGRKHEEVLNCLNNLPEANGRSIVMDSWGIFKYE